MITNRVKSAIGFGVMMAICLIVQNLIIYPSDTLRQIVKSVGTGLLSGAVAGILFGWLTTTEWFLKITKNKRNDSK